MVRLLRANEYGSRTGTCIWYFLVISILICMSVVWNDMESTRFCKPQILILRKSDPRVYVTRPGILRHVFPLRPFPVKHRHHESFGEACYPADSTASCEERLTVLSSLLSRQLQLLASQDLELILGAFDALNLLLDPLDEAAENVSLGLDLVPLGWREATLGKDAVEAGSLLGGPALVVANPVKDPEVVLGVLVGRVFRHLAGLIMGLVRILLDSSTGLVELGDNAVKGRQGAGVHVKPTARNPVKTGVRVDKGQKAILCPRTFV